MVCSEPLKKAWQSFVTKHAVLDCLGMRCPAPIIAVAKHLKNEPVGAEVLLLADDPATAPDISAWARMTHNHSEQLEPNRYLVRKLATY